MKTFNNAKSKTHKILSMFLIICMIFTIMPTMAFAENTVNMEFGYDDSFGTVTGTMPSIVVTGDNYELPECGFTPPEGYQFKEWTLSYLIYGEWSEKYLWDHNQPGDEVYVADYSDYKLVAEWEKPMVMTVSPEFIEQGGTRLFEAEILKSKSQDINWTVTGASSSETTIDADGRLTTGSDETATELTVTATSADDSSKSVSSVITVTATRTVSICFAYYGDPETVTGTMERLTTTDETYTLPACGFTPSEGWVFDGWQVNYKKEGSDSYNGAERGKYQPDDVVKLNLSTEYEMNATWKKAEIAQKTCTITYCVPGATPVTDVPVGEPFTLMTDLPVTPPDDMKFLGWTLNSDGTGEAITTVTPTGDTFVYAILDKVAVDPVLPTVTGDNQEITVGTNQDVEFTIKGEISTNDFIRLEYEGVELDKENYTVKDGSIIITLKGDYVDDLAVGKHVFTAVLYGRTTREIEVPMTLNVVDKAQDEVFFELKYHANGGSGYMDDDWEGCIYGKEVTLSQNEFTAPVGKTFVAWAIGSVDGPRVAAGGKYVFTLEPNNTSNMEHAYAIWKNKSTGSSGGSSYKPTVTLNREDHFAYMKGYPDETFAQNANITRAEATVMFSRLLEEPMDANKTYTTDFTDVETGNWFANQVAYMENLGIVSGYADGTFKPNESITRAEFAAIASRFDELAITDENKFNDVTEKHWAVGYINSAAEKQWINGYPDGTFKPEQSITRAEAVTLVNNVLERNCDEKFADTHKDELAQFTDVTKAHWAYYDVMEATNNHDYTKDTKGNETWVELD